MFHEPKPFGDDNEELGPIVKLRNIMNRPVVVIPTSYDPEAKDLNDKVTGNLVMKVIVLGGGEVRFGDNRFEGTDATARVEVPYIAEPVFSSHVNVMRTLKGIAGQGIASLGRFVYGTSKKANNSKPINFEPLDPKDPIRAVAEAVYRQIGDGTFVNPTPIDIATGKPLATAPKDDAPAAAAPAAEVDFSKPPAGMSQAVWDALNPDQRAALAG